MASADDPTTVNTPDDVGTTKLILDLLKMASNGIAPTDMKDEMADEQSGLNIGAWIFGG